jgi:hypothetical protein
VWFGIDIRFYLEKKYNYAKTYKRKANSIYLETVKGSVKIKKAFYDRLRGREKRVISYFMIHDF